VTSARRPARLNIDRLSTKISFSLSAAGH